jgi:hypothetical protein
MQKAALGLAGAYAVAIVAAMLALTSVKQGLSLKDNPPAWPYLLMIIANVLPPVGACQIVRRAKYLEVKFAAFLTEIIIISIEAIFTCLMFKPETETDVALIYVGLPFASCALLAVSSACAIGYRLLRS